MVLKEGAGDCKQTRFLALDKCLPGRSFLQLLDIDKKCDAPPQLELDPEWLCVLRSTNHLLNLRKTFTYLPGPGSADRCGTERRQQACT